MFWKAHSFIKMPNLELYCERNISQIFTQIMTVWRIYIYYMKMVKTFPSLFVFEQLMCADKNNNNQIIIILFRVSLHSSFFGEYRIAKWQKKEKKKLKHRKLRHCATGTVLLSHRTVLMSAQTRAHEAHFISQFFLYY